MKLIYHGVCSILHLNSRVFAEHEASGRPVDGQILNGLDWDGLGSVIRKI